MGNTNIEILTKDIADFTRIRRGNVEEALAVLSGVDLTDDSSPYDSDIIEIGGARAVYIYVSYTITGAATVGTFRWFALPVDSDDSTFVSEEIGASHEVTSSNKLRMVVLPGRTQTGVISAGGMEGVLLAVPRFKFRLQVDTASDAATSAVASVDLFIAR